MWSDYYESPVSVVEKLHQCYIEGTKITCNYVYCRYSEEFLTVEDAEIAMEIHAEQEETK
jgi:hypothetical protein